MQYRSAMTTRRHGSDKHLRLDIGGRHEKACVTDKHTHRCDHRSERNRSTQRRRSSNTRLRTWLRSSALTDSKTLFEHQVKNRTLMTIENIDRSDLRSSFLPRIYAERPRFTVTDAQGHRPRLIIRNGNGPNYVQSDVPTSPTWQPKP